jgi:hypothetical protein
MENILTGTSTGKYKQQESAKPAETGHISGKEV